MITVVNKYCKKSSILHGYLYVKTGTGSDQILKKRIQILPNFGNLIKIRPFFGKLVRIQPRIRHSDPHPCLKYSDHISANISFQMDTIEWSSILGDGVQWKRQERQYRKKYELKKISSACNLAIFNWN